MNRPGQPPARPPSLGPNPGLASQFRPPYPYTMQPRNVNVLPTGGYVPNLQQRTPGAQTPGLGVPPQTPFIQSRTQSSFPFSAGLGQQQHQPSSTTTLQQQPQPPQQQQQPQPQPNGSSPFTPSLGTAPSASSASEVGLDPNDFPALGSTSSNANSGGSNGGAGSGATTSYASQASALSAAANGGVIGGGGTIGASQSRDFTPDDFPALGGQVQAQGQTQTQDVSHVHPPPGLNGFPRTDSPTQQSRQNLLGALTGEITRSVPGMLNLGPQARGLHSGFGQNHLSEAEKQQQQQRNNFNLKLNQSAQAAWTSPNMNPGSQSQGIAGGASYTGTSQASAQQQNGNNPPSSHLVGPPGVPPPPVQHTSGSSHGQQHPQTPAQQVLMSAADRWGLLGLLAMIKSSNSDIDQNLTMIGSDLGTMGLDMGYSGSSNLYSTFITPWSDQSVAHLVEPDFHLPSAYNINTAPPGPAKAAAFSDETLFYMFYASPRDALQEIAAQELWNRNWRYHKELRLWITKESGTTPSQKVPGGENGQYTYWDPENWIRERKDMVVIYADLEEKNVPAFAPGQTLSLAPRPGQQAQPLVGSAA